MGRVNGLHYTDIVDLEDEFGVSVAEYTHTHLILALLSNGHHSRVRVHSLVEAVGLRVFCIPEYGVEVVGVSFSPHQFATIELTELCFGL